MNDHFKATGRMPVPEESLSDEAVIHQGVPMNDPERDHDADLAAVRDSDYGRYLDKLDREAERSLAQFYADMARLAKREES